MRTVDEGVQVADKLSQENRGEFPHAGWLQKNGYVDLLYLIRKHPEKFSHLKKKNLTIECVKVDQVEVAERLAHDNEGEIPNTGWLQKNGYVGLSRAMNKHPEKFSHLKRKYIAFKPLIPFEFPSEPIVSPEIQARLLSLGLRSRPSFLLVDVTVNNT